MSKIQFDSKTVLKMADLARIELSNQEAESFGSHIQKILSYIDKLSEVATEGVEPLDLGDLVLRNQEIATPVREDVLVPSPGASAILKSAPESMYDNYKVPQVLGGGH